MENRKDMSQASCGCGINGYCHHRSMGACVLKTLIGLVLVVVVFLLGLSVGVRIGMRREGLRPSVMGRSMMQTTPGQMMNPSGMRGNNNNSMMGGTWMQNGGGMMGDTSTTRMFGSIIKIDGSTITISDNAAKQQTIMSESNTLIVTATGETSLASLKVGQNISARGTLDQTGTLDATFIQTF